MVPDDIGGNFGTIAQALAGRLMYGVTRPVFGIAGMKRSKGKAAFGFTGGRRTVYRLSTASRAASVALLAGPGCFASPMTRTGRPIAFTVSSRGLWGRTPSASTMVS